MTVVSEGPLCLKIHLNKSELKKYFVSYGDIHFNDPNVKKTITMLFETAIRSAEFETNGKRTIEVFPTSSGGCVLKFTSEPIPTDKLNLHNIRLKSKRGKNNPYIFAFDDFETVLQVVDRLYLNNTTKDYICSLYNIKSRYFLKIVIPIFDIKTGIFINEFSLYSAKGLKVEAILEEYGKCLIYKNAIKVLNNFFIKRNYN